MSSLCVIRTRPQHKTGWGEEESLPTELGEMRLDLLVGLQELFVCFLQRIAPIGRRQGTRVLTNFLFSPADMVPKPLKCF
jgi:hypothetical protein